MLFNRDLNKKNTPFFKLNFVSLKNYLQFRNFAFIFLSTIDILLRIWNFNIPEFSYISLSKFYLPCIWIEICPSNWSKWASTLFSALLLSIIGCCSFGKWIWLNKSRNYVHILLVHLIEGANVENYLERSD